MSLRQLHAGRVRENVDAESGEETPKKSSPARIVVSEQHYEVDVKQRCSATEQVDVVEHQCLCQT